MRETFFSNPNRGFNYSRLGLQSSRTVLFERRSLTVGYRFLLPHCRHVINTVVPVSDLILIRQLRPGTRRLPHFLQMDAFVSRVRRTPDFIPIKRASSTYLLEREGSSEKVCLARRSNISIRSRAICRMVPLRHVKCLP